MQRFSTAQQINPQEITNENRSGLLKRWVAAKADIEETMDRFGMTRNQVVKLAQLTSDDIEKMAASGIALFAFKASEKLLELATVATDSRDLARMMVLHG